MKKNYLKKASLILAAAAMLSVCGLTASAESVAPADEVTVCTATADEAFTAVYDYGTDYDYDIIQTADSSSNEKESKNWVEIILIALGVSILVTGIVVYIIYRGYKYNGMTEPYEYKDKAPLELTEREDVLVDVHVTSRHIERNKN